MSVRKTSSSVGRRRPISSTAIEASSRQPITAASSAGPPGARAVTCRPPGSSRAGLSVTRSRICPTAPTSAGSVTATLDDVLADAGLELAERAGRDDPAVIDHHDLVGQLVGFVEVVRGQQDVGAARGQAAHGVPDLAPADRIQAGRRLVEQQQPRPADQAGAQVEPAPLAAGVGAAAPVGDLRRG